MNANTTSAKQKKSVLTHKHYQVDCMLSTAYQSNSYPARIDIYVRSKSELLAVLMNHDIQLDGTKIKEIAG